MDDQCESWLVQTVRFNIRISKNWSLPVARLARVRTLISDLEVGKAGQATILGPGSRWSCKEDCASFWLVDSGFSFCVDVKNGPVVLTVQLSDSTFFADLPVQPRVVPDQPLQTLR